MARSSYIYIAMQGTLLVAAYTVRHECVSWFKREGKTLANLRVYRVRDGLASGSKLDITEHIATLAQ